MKTIITESELHQIITEAIKMEMLNEVGLRDYLGAAKQGMKTAWNRRRNVQNYTTDTGANGAVRTTGGFMNNFRQGYNASMANASGEEAKAAATDEYNKDMERWEAARDNFKAIDQEIQAKYGKATRGANGQYNNRLRQGKDAFVQGAADKAAGAYNRRANDAAAAAQQRRAKDAQVNATAMQQGTVQNVN